MKLIFNIDYQTVFGEELLLNLVEKDGAENHVSSYRMKTEDGMRWTYELNCPAAPSSKSKAKFELGSVIDYYYSVESSGQLVRQEWMVEPHRLELVSEKGYNYTIYDHWIDIPDDSYLYSSAFTDCIARHTPAKSPMKPYTATVRLKVRAPQLRERERLALVGSDELLGAWDAKRSQPMTEHNHNEWMVNLDATMLLSKRLEFKFIIIDEDTNIATIWESGENRVIELPPVGRGDVVVYELPQAFFPLYAQKCAGTLVPVFSLRSHDSFGVGDFGDLRKMIDWVSMTRQRLLQILPINDTTTTHTWTDSYPYSCISIFAIHPQYVDLTQLAAAATGRREGACSFRSPAPGTECTAAD